MAAIPLDLLDRLRDAETAIRQLAGRVNIRPALDLVIDGIVRIGSGGTLRVDRHDGGYALYTGDIDYPYTDGAPQRGTLLFHDNTKIAVGVYAYGAAGPGTDAPDVQRVHIRDPDGTPTLLTHPAGGLARPYLGIPMYPMTVSQWPVATGAGWTDLWVAEFARQHPRIRVAAEAFTNAAGTVGELRLLVNGSQVGGVSTHNASAFSYGVWSGDVPGAHMATTVILVQGRVASGPGAIVARIHEAHGGEA